MLKQRAIKAQYQGNAMSDIRRKFMSAMAGLVLAVLGGTASAESFPTHAITFIVPRSPGGGSDVLMRILAPGLGKKLGVPVVIQNQADATAILGAEIVSRAAADGYTLYVSDNSFYQNPAILPHVPYDTIKDFSAVTMLAEGPVILLVHPSLPATNLKELIALAKKEPGVLSFASGGIGSSTHLAGVLLNLKAGTTMIHVPFKSSGQALNALLGDQVSMQFGGISSARPLIAAGKVRAIAVTGDKRDAAAPDVPTLQEEGLAGADVMSLWGIHAPAGTPLNVRVKLRDALVEVMRDPATTKQLNNLGYTIVGDTPEEQQALTNKTVQFWVDLSKKVDLHH
jgi:tripartite-type tricarboxylate transporter receptor subunit TctC